MSTFTRFSAVQQLQFDQASSRAYNKSLWKLIPGFRYYVGSEDSGVYVDVPTGFLTDGATIPRFLWWLLPPIDEYSQATTLHDRLCSVYTVTVVKNGVATETKVTRKVIDGILDEAMGVLEITPWKRRLIMAGVNLYRLIKNPTEPKSLVESIS